MVLISSVMTFSLLAPPSSPVCCNNLQVCIQLFSCVPNFASPFTTTGWSTCLLVCPLSVSNWTQSGCSRHGFPLTRESIVTLLESWYGKLSCKRRELESPIGHHHHECKIAPQSQTLLCGMINLLYTSRNFTWTLAGGTNFSSGGMGSASS